MSLTLRVVSTFEAVDAFDARGVYHMVRDSNFSMAGSVFLSFLPGAGRKNVVLTVKFRPLFFFRGQLGCVWESWIEPDLKMHAFA